MRKACLFGLLLALAPVASAWAGVPGALNFSGRLGSTEGDFTGAARITLTLYDDATAVDAWNVLWTETQELFVVSGRFHMLLGADPSNPLPLDALNRDELFVGVGVNEGEELAPRLRVASVPFALRASDARTLQGAGPDAFAGAAHGHAFSDLAGVASESQLPGTVILAPVLSAALEQKADVDAVQEALASKAAIGHDHDGAYVGAGQPASVNSEMLVDGTILFEDLGDNGCADGEVIQLDGARSAWKCGQLRTWSGADFALSGQSCEQADWSVVGIGADGTILCAQDVDVAYAAGTGLVLEGVEFAIDQPALVAILDSRYVQPLDLAMALATKADLLHGHGLDEVTGLQAVLDALSADVALRARTTYVDGALATKADLLHGHGLGEVTGLVEALDGVQSDLAGKAPLSHGHDLNAIETPPGCMSGQVIKLEADGWGCRDDIDTQYVASTGLHLDETARAFSLDEGYQTGANFDDRFVNASGDTISGNLAVTGVITATSFSGDGSLLTGLSTNSDTVDGYHASSVAGPGVLLALNEAGILATSITGNASNVTGIVGISNGGTGANSAEIARSNLGLRALATLDAVSGGTGGTLTDGTVVNADLAQGNFQNIQGVGTLGSLTVSGTTLTATSSGTLSVGLTSSPASGKFVVSGSSGTLTGPSASYVGRFISGTTSAAVTAEATSGTGYLAVDTSGHTVAGGSKGLRLFANGGEKVRIDTNGNVGIGNSSPGYKLDVSGDLRVTGNLMANTYACASARDLKADIDPLSEDEYATILGRIRDMDVVRYRYREEPADGKRHMGLIADDSPADILAPGGRAVSLYDYVGYLTAGVRQLARENERMRAENVRLQRALDRIERRLNRGGRR